MVRINLSTRPFYNERLVTFVIAVLGLAALGVAAFSVQQIVSLSSKRTALRSQIAQGEAATNRANIETEAIQKSINARALKGLALNANQANQLIDERTFSWTVFFSLIGKTLPDGQRHATTGFAASEVDGRIALVRDAAGDRFPGVELNALIQAVVPSEDALTAAEGLAKNLPGLSPEQILETPFVLIGSADRMAEALLERRERWGISYYSMFGPAMDALAPVIARLN